MALIRALVANSHSASLPMDFSGRVESSTSYSNPKTAMTWKTKSRTPTISLSTCSGVQMMWASSWVNWRTRVRPCSTPERSWRSTVPSSK